MNLTIRLLVFTIGLFIGLALTGCQAGGDCAGDHCVCPVTESCEHDCTVGGNECHVQSSPGQAIDIQCADNEECHVECMTSPSCRVDCGGSSECHVTCPASGCTVTDCSGPGCVVSCGTTGAATRTGATATCP